MINPEKSNVKEWLEAVKKASSEKKGIWKSVYKHLAVPRRRRVSVNLFKLDKYTKDGDKVVVPGKVLSTGKISHSIDIVAMEYSAKALEKLKASNCNIRDLSYMINEKNVKVVV